MSNTMSYNLRLRAYKQQRGMQARHCSLALACCEWKVTICSCRVTMQHACNQALGSRQTHLLTVLGEQAFIKKLVETSWLFGNPALPCSLQYMHVHISHLPTTQCFWETRSTVVGINLNWIGAAAGRFFPLFLYAAAGPFFAVFPREQFVFLYLS